MSITGCSWLLTGDDAQSLMFPLWAGRILIVARQERFENTTRSFTWFFGLFFFSHICYLSASLSWDTGSSLCYLVIFFPSRSPPPAVWWSFLPSPSVSQCGTHRDGARQQGRPLKRADLKRGNNNHACSSYRRHWNLKDLPKCTVPGLKKKNSVLTGLLGNVDVLKGSPEIFGKRDHISCPAKS